MDLGAELLPFLGLHWTCSAPCYWCRTGAAPVWFEGKNLCFPFQQLPPSTQLGSQQVQGRETTPAAGAEDPKLDKLQPPARGKQENPLSVNAAGSCLKSHPSHERLPAVHPQHAEQMGRSRGAGGRGGLLHTTAPPTLEHWHDAGTRPRHSSVALAGNLLCFAKLSLSYVFIARKP